MREIDITNALKAKHMAKDIFAAQVKIGPAGSKIMDAVAVKKTWSPRTIIGYEIKVSRADFLSDQKHPHYMKNCNIFYFVAPKGIIEKSEIPEGAGLMICNENGTLWTSKKAPYRDEPISVDVLLHIMFWKFDRFLGYRTKAETLEDYKASRELASLGKDITRKISNLEENTQRYKDYYEKYRMRYREVLEECQKLKEEKGTLVKGLTERDLFVLKKDIFVLKKDIERLSEIAEKIES